MARIARDRDWYWPRWATVCDPHQSWNRNRIFQKSSCGDVDLTCEILLWLYQLLAAWAEAQHFWRPRTLYLYCQGIFGTRRRRAYFQIRSGHNLRSFSKLRHWSDESCGSLHSWRCTLDNWFWDIRLGTSRPASFRLLWSKGGNNGCRTFYSYKAEASQYISVWCNYVCGR